MSIGGNLSVAMIANDFGVSGAANPTGNAGRISAGILEDTPFRKMISQAIANNGPQNKTTAADTDLSASDSGTQQETPSVNDLLATLLFGNAGQSKLKLSDAETTATIAVSGESTETDPEASDLSADSLASMLAMFDGAFRASLVTNGEAGTSKDELSAENLAEILESIQPGRNGISGLLNRNISLGTHGELSEQPNQKDAITLLSQIIDESGKMTVTVEIGGKTIELAGSVSSSGNTGSETTTEAEAETQGMNLDELTALLKHTGPNASGLGLGQLNSAQNDTESGIIGSGVNEASSQVFSAAGGNGNDVSTDGGIEEESLQQNSAADNSSANTQVVDESLKAAAYQSQLQNTGTQDVSAMNQLSQSAEGAEAYSQISEQILTSLEKKGPSEFRMQLQPENLGQIDISLKISAGKLIIDIMADKAQTQALLTGQVDKLISSMGLQNVQVESVQVNQQMNSDSQNSQNQAYQMNSGMNFANGRQNSGEMNETWRQISNGLFGSQTDHPAEDGLEGIQQIRSGFGRMNYVI